MPACPSRLELSRWEAFPEANRPIEIASHLGQCGRCAAIVGDITDARAVLFGSAPAEISARAAQTILARTSERKLRNRWLPRLLPAFLIPAAAALLLFARPLRHASHGDGVKGSLIVETYCKRGEQVFAAEDGADFRQGDLLRFAYTQDRPGFIAIFGVDDTGQVFPYYEERSLVGVPAEPGAHVLLPGSVELDGHRGFERVFAIWSEKQLRDDAVRSAISVAMTAANGDLRRMTALDLPVEQVSLLLRRP